MLQFSNLLKEWILTVFISAVQISALAFLGYYIYLDAQKRGVTNPGTWAILCFFLIGVPFYLLLRPERKSRLSGSEISSLSGFVSLLLSLVLANLVFGRELAGYKFGTIFEMSVLLVIFAVVIYPVASKIIKSATHD